jgi:hypothetical protein
MLVRIARRDVEGGELDVAVRQIAESSAQGSGQTWAVLRLFESNPLPEPWGLVVKKGTNRLPDSGSPGPSSSTAISTLALAALQRTRTSPPVSSAASAALRTRLMSS